MSETQTAPNRIPKPICRSCGHHFDHHRAYKIYCEGDEGRCRCEHYWAPSER